VGILPRAVGKAMCWGSQPERFPWGREQFTIPCGGFCRPGKNAYLFFALAFVLQCDNSTFRFPVSYTAILRGQRTSSTSGQPAPQVTACIAPYPSCSI